MTTAILARSNYATPDGPLRTHRATEYDAIARITARLKQAADGDGGRFPDLARALHDNRRLWTTLAADLAEPGNALPKTLRAQLMFLAQFSLEHSRKVLAREGDVTPLVDVNMALLRGLRGDRGTEE